MRYRGQQPVDGGICLHAISKATEEAEKQEAQKMQEADKAKQV